MNHIKIVDAAEVKTGNSPHLRLQRVNDVIIKETRMQDNRPVRLVRTDGPSEGIKQIFNECRIS